MPRFTGEEPVNVLGEAEVRDDFLIYAVSNTSAFDIDYLPYDLLLGQLSEANESNKSARELYSALDENFKLLENGVFVVRKVAPLDGQLDGIFPTAQVSLRWVGQDNQSRLDNDPMVLLAIDPVAGAVVDWSPVQIMDEQQSGFTFSLVPIDLDQRAVDADDFIDACSLWRGRAQLVFCIGAFEVSDCLPSFDPLRLEDEQEYPYRLYWPNIAGQLASAPKDVAEVIDRKIKQKEELQRIDSGGQIINIHPDYVQDFDSDVLLFCHGIISSTEGAFNELFQDPVFMSALRVKYDRRIIAWDHWTLSKTTSENAKNLADELSYLQDVTLDIICHSRGAGVMRNFLESDATRKFLNDNNIKVNVCIFVAGACLGSQLAIDKNVKRLFRRIKLLTWLFDVSGPWLSGFIALIKAMALGAQTFPGAKSMDPTGQEIMRLNGYDGKTRADRYAYLRANYEASSWPMKLAEDYFWDQPIFGGAANDLVVPFDGASPSGKYLQNDPVTMEDVRKFGDWKKGQSKVNHIKFFKQAETKRDLRTVLSI